MDIYFTQLRIALDELLKFTNKVYRRDLKFI